MSEAAAAIVRLTDNQLQQRIKLNASLGFGLQDATPAQLNMIYILARRYDLDPVTDLTLYRGVPWVKDQGWFRIIRRHNEFAGIVTRPLSGEEKKLWGYAEDDVVIECTITTHSWGQISARGRARRAEIDEARERARETKRASAPIGIYDVEIAEKRAIARAAKLAFGQDVPDEADIERQVNEETERRRDPVHVREMSDKYERILGEQAYQLPERTAEAAVVEEDDGPGLDSPAPAEPPQDAAQVEDLLKAPSAWERHRELSEEAVALRVRVKTLRADTPLADVEAYNRELEERIATETERRRSIARQNLDKAAS